MPTPVAKAKQIDGKSRSKSVFRTYLKKYSYGSSEADKFRVFLYELQKQEERGIKIANPRHIRNEKNFQDKPHLRIPAI